MIISVHMPKTAGTSFAAALEAEYRARLLRDYDDFPVNTPVRERNRAALRACLGNAEKEFGSIACIHGHFLPLKYLLLAGKQEVSFVTWLRNPVDRVISNYYFWQRCFDPHTALPLHRKMMEENWSLERFCLGAELKDLYCQFLYGFPLEYFSFIGITEFYEEDLVYFSAHYLQSSVEAQRLNVGNARGRYEIGRSLRREIEQHHSGDMNLYRRALEYRLARKETASHRGSEDCRYAISVHRSGTWHDMTVYARVAADRQGDRSDCSLGVADSRDGSGERLSRRLCELPEAGVE